MRTDHAGDADLGLHAGFQLLGFGTGPGESGAEPSAAAKAKGKRAVKCDACLNEANGPACVNACPTGAAVRIGPERFIDLIEKP